MSYKILIAGTTSSGKTTVVEKIRSLKIPGVFVGSEVARELLEKDPELFKDPNFQHILYNEQTRREKVAESKGALISIWDSGIAVNLGYAMLFGQEISAETKQLWIEHSKSYNKVFLLNKDDISFELTPLQKQTAGNDWLQLRDKVHDHIILALQECGLEYELLSGTVEHRMSIISKEIQFGFLNVEGQYKRKGKER